MEERTAPTRPLAVASASPTLEVAPGTAEQLARLTHFSDLDDVPEIGELDAVARFVIGDVGGRQQAMGLWNQLADNCRRLWHLISDDWDDRDLDELTEEQSVRLPLTASSEQEELLRYEVTRDRLSHDIEQAVWLARYRAAETRRTAAAL